MLKFATYVRVDHGSVPAGYVYQEQTLTFARRETIQGTAFEFVDDFLRRLNLCDPLEELLAFQALWTHARLGRLSHPANQQEGREGMKAVNDACDRAANTYRRQMLALAEYRRPPRSESFVAIKQANVAQQQVVQNAQVQNSQNPTASNEKGLLPADGEAAPALPADSRGVAVPPGTVEHERAEARRADGRTDRGAAGGVDHAPHPARDGRPEEIISRCGRR